MIVPFRLGNQVKILIPSHKNSPPNLIWASLVFLLVLIFSPQSFGVSVAGCPGTAMKVHPVPFKKRNIAVQYDVNPGRNASSIGSHHSKNLRRLPHIFSRVLELPFRSDADVEVEEGPGFFRFVAETDGIGEDVRAHTIEIHPGVTKVVVRPNGSLGLLPLDQLELDMWRFRLPQSTRPELASAVCVDGELIVTVPKGEDEEDEEVEDGEGEVWGGGNGNRLVLVQ